MFKEEVRLHTQLFSKQKLLAFPLVIATLLGLAAYSSTQYLNLISVNIFITVTHILIFFFGMQTGSIAFKSRDMVENLLGESTFLLYTGTILPVNEKKLVGVFILKDILFYSFVFFLPVSVALGGTTYNFTLIPTLLLTITLVFCLGLTFTITAISLQFKSKYSLLGILTVISGIIVFLIQTETFTLNYFTLTNLYSISLLSLTTIVFALMSILTFELPSKTTQKETKNHSTFITRLQKKHSFFNVKQKAIFYKTNIDILRSSGGVWKILISTAVLIILGITLEHLLTNQLPIQPYQALLYTTILMMGSFTTYTWVYQMDSKEEYTIHPISNKDFINGKFASFMLITISSVLLLIAGTAVYYNSSLIEITTSLLFGMAFSIFYYGVTVYHAGTQPNELLFDSTRFTKFSTIIMITTLPVLIYSLIGSIILSEIIGLGLIVAESIPLVIVGLILKNKTDDIL